MTMQNEPFLLSPAGKDYLWGGRRLADDYAKDLHLTPLAETWECSTHPDGECRVASGAYEGQTLTQVLRAHPAFLGTHPLHTYGDDALQGQIPILVKFIDADKDLSVQVHPDDAYAASCENGQRGKTEMWYVVDAAPGAQLVYGFNRDMEAGAVRSAIDGGTIERYLQHVPVRRGDVYYIEAGTVHAIGAGALIVEVQENSNLTYRLYDYHRTDKNGQERELHVDKALVVANLGAAPAPRQPIRVLRYRPGCASELLCRCRYFAVERLLVNTERVREMALLQSRSTSFEVLVCTDGCGVLFWTTDQGEERVLRMYRGDTVFLPADSTPVYLHGRAEMLRVTC